MLCSRLSMGRRWVARVCRLRLFRGWGVLCGVVAGFSGWYVRVLFVFFFVCLFGVWLLFGVVIC